MSIIVIAKELFMSEADWHLVRGGHPQLIGSHRRSTGEAFQFLPLFRTHREAVHYCRQSGLWHQHIRPRHNEVSNKTSTRKDNGLVGLLHQAATEGVVIVGVFVGFNNAHESRWEFLRSPSHDVSTPLRLSAFELLPEEDGPFDGG